MDTRFNSFHTDETTPYVKAMVDLLNETQLRAYRPWWYTAMMREANRNFDEKKKLLRQLTDNVISRRRTHPHLDKEDLVDVMLNRNDPKTGQRLDDSTIIDNMITFLIAGKSLICTHSP